MYSVCRRKWAPLINILQQQLQSYTKLNKILHPQSHVYLKPGILQVQALADISRVGFVVVMKPVHQLQIRPIVHN